MPKKAGMEQWKKYSTFLQRDAKGNLYIVLKYI